MSVLTPKVLDDYICFDEAECVAAGKALAERLQAELNIKAQMVSEGQIVQI